MVAVVGQPYRDAITLRDASGALVSGAAWSVAYAVRQDGTAFGLDPIAESLPGSGVYPVSFTPAAPLAHHLWLTATKAAAGFLQHWATTVFAAAAAVPVEHVATVPQEELLVLLDGAGQPIPGAAFGVVPQSAIAPAGDPFAPVVVATSRDGAYLVRSTPLLPGYRRAEIETTNVAPPQRWVAAYTAERAGAPVPGPGPIPSGQVTWTPATAKHGAVAWSEKGTPMAPLAIKRGDTEEWALALHDAAGNPQPLSGVSVWWTVRPSVPVPPGEDLPDAQAVIKAWWQHNGASVVTSGVTGPDGSAGGTFVADGIGTGQMTLRLLPHLTTALPLQPAGGGQYRYDVQLAWTPDEVHTFDEGTLTVSPDVTRRTSMP